MNSCLKDRTLWYDGTNQVTPDNVPSLFLLNVPQEKIVVTELNADIELFNSISDIPISSEKTANSIPEMVWQIPKSFSEINLDDFVASKIAEKGLSNEYVERARIELIEVKRLNVEMLFRTMIYIVHRLQAEKKVWGVGRGSSCASLVLHLIGVHEVDPVKYKIPLEEFFH